MAEAWALPLSTLAIIVFFSLLPSTSSTYPTLGNFQAIAGSQAILVLTALAVLLPLIGQEYDLSVGANLGLSSVLSATLMASDWPLVPAALAGIACGAAVGMVNGLLVTWARVSAVIATLGTATLLHGAVFARTGGTSVVEGISEPLVDFGSDTTFGVPQTLWAVLAATLLVYYVLAHTPYGRRLYMLGDNRRATRLVGLRPDRLLFSTFVAGGALAGLAGVLQVARAGSADPRAGESFTLPALAAAFLSAAAIRPGEHNVGGVLAAIVFLASLNGGLNLAGAAPHVADFVNGTALIAGVALAAYLGRRRGRAAD